MNVGSFLVIFAIVSGALALWVDQRFPRLAPATMIGALVHVLVSLAAAQILVPLVLRVLLADASESSRLAGVFGVALPALTYTLLAAIWILKSMHRTLRGLPR